MHLRKICQRGFHIPSALRNLCQAKNRIRIIFLRREPVQIRRKIDGHHRGVLVRELAPRAPQRGRVPLRPGEQEHEIVGRAAEKGQVDVDLVVDAEQRTSIARRILDQVLWTAAATMTPQFAPSTFSSEPYRKLIVEVIREAAAAGDVVIVAHAASQALTGRPGVLRVLVTAPEDVRAGRLAKAEGVDGRGGEKLVRESDAARVLSRPSIRNSATGNSRFTACAIVSGE